MTLDRLAVPSRAAPRLRRAAARLWAQLWWSVRLHVAELHHLPRPDPPRELPPEAWRGLRLFDHL